jgi:hypothetical protein
MQFHRRPLATGTSDMMDDHKVWRREAVFACQVKLEMQATDETRSTPTFQHVLQLGHGHGEVLRVGPAHNIAILLR